MAVFYLIRHGKHTYKSVNGKGFVGHGLELAPLSEEGAIQAYECSKDIRLKDCDLIISSPYTRTMQTSAILSKHLGIDIKVELDLREQELDLSYKVKSYDELKQIAIEEQKYNGGISINKAYNWELRSDVKERTLNVLKQYKCYNKIIVVCHGMVINCLTGKVGIPNCSIHEIIID